VKNLAGHFSCGEQKGPADELCTHVRARVCVHAGTLNIYGDLAGETCTRLILAADDLLDFPAAIIVMPSKPSAGVIRGAARRIQKPFHDHFPSTSRRGGRGDGSEEGAHVSTRCSQNSHRAAQFLLGVCDNRQR